MYNGTIEIIESVSGSQDIVNIATDIAPGVSLIFWIILIFLIISIAGIALKNYLEKYAIYISIKFDSFLNKGDCIDYRGFKGIIKKITPNYILLEKNGKENNGSKIYRRIPIKVWDSWHRDHFKVGYQEILKDVGEKEE